MNMYINGVVISGAGKIRAENQDNYYLDGIYRENPNDSTIQQFQCSGKSEGLFAVTDGMGGESFGELASLLTVQSMHAIPPDSGEDDICAYLQEANLKICSLIEEKGGRRIGSTFAGVSIYESSAVTVNIGDSRIYMLHDGNLVQISVDHTSIRTMIDMGMLTPEAAKKHPDRHRLAQHLGIFPDEMIIEPYSKTVSVQPGDIFLICSDGLTDMLEDSEISSALSGKETVVEKAKALFDSAMQAGGKDNITVMVIEMKGKTLGEKVLNFLGKIKNKF